MKRIRAFLFKHRTAAVLLAAVFLFCGVRRFSERGIEWNIGLAPDEYAVARWINDVHDDGYISRRVYPGGWFQLAQIKVWFDFNAARNAIQEEFRRSQDGGMHTAASKSSLMRLKQTVSHVADIQSGRDFNVILLSFASVFMFFGALAQRRHPVAALIPGLVLGLHPFIQEHAHYCETDIALVFSLALSLLAFEFAGRNDRSPARLFLLCFSAGFAISCKYTLIPLLALPVVQTAAFVKARRATAARPPRFGMPAAACALAAFALLAGFTLGTPALYMDPEFFFSSAKTTSDRTYAEIHGILGRYSGVWWAPYTLRARGLLHEGAKLGIIFQTWSAVALLFCLRLPRRSGRRCVPMLMLLFLLFFVIFMPWIRNQEFLPFVVFIAAASAAPVDWAIRVFREKPVKRRIAGAVFVIAFSAVVLASVYRQGERMTSAFHRRETRAECQNWLSAATDGSSAIATDQYLGCIAHESSIPVVSAPYLDEHYPEMLSNPDISTIAPRYFLWNRSFNGRFSQRHPFTGRLIPEAQRRHNRFLGECLRLKTWEISEGSIRPAFSQPDIELRMIPGPDASEGSVSLPFHYLRPALFRWSGHDLYAGDGAPLLGPRTGIQTVSARRYVRPFLPDSCGSVWAVCCMEFGSENAEIRWSGGFAPRKAALSAGGAAAFRMKRGHDWSGADRDVRQGARLRMRGNDQTCLCLTDITGDAAEVAYLLRVHGNSADSLNLAKCDENPGEALQIEGFRAAVALGEKPPEKWIATARAALAAYDEFANSASSVPEHLAFCGTPLRCLRDFAHIRILQCEIDAEIELPVFLPEGDYGLTVCSEPGVWCPEFDAGLFNVDADQFVSVSTTNRMEIRTSTLHVPRPTRLKLGRNLPDRINPVVMDVTISWDPLERLQDEIEGLRADIASLDSSSCSAAVNSGGRQSGSGAENTAQNPGR